jgi:hypothetical protein
VTVAGVEQVSGMSANDFTHPVTYTVTAQDGSTRSYVVTLTTHGFATNVEFATASAPESVAIGDLNADGKPDLVLSSSGKISVLLNTTPNGATTPSFATHVDFAATGPYTAVIADLNGDGKPDLAVASEYGPAVSVLLNTTAAGATTPSFTGAVNFTTGSQPVSIAIADLNGDGKPDLVAADSNATAVSVLLNTTANGATTPSFAAKVDFATDTAPTHVAAADINSDGKPDLVVVDVDLSAQTSLVTVLLNTTAPAAATPSFAAMVGFPTRGGIRFAAGDLDGDGKPDLVTAASGANVVSVLLDTTTSGATTPTFTSHVEFATGMWANSVAIGDFDGDGKPDLAVSANTSNVVSVLLNATASGATTPKFTRTTDFATGAGPTYVATGDLNGDGKLDLALANHTANTVSVLLATAP